MQRKLNLFAFLPARPISSKDSMHLILKSSKAKGEWSFKRKDNEGKIKGIIDKFSKKYGVGIDRDGNYGSESLE